eukprot:gene15514-17380_t
MMMDALEIFSRLPIDIFLYLKTFMNHKIFIALISTSNKLFRKIRQQTIYYHLPPELSYRFCLFDETQELFVGKVVDPRRQIELNLSETSLFRSDHTGEPEVFLKVHRVNLKNYCGALSSLRFLYELEFQGKVPDLSAFPSECSLLTMRLKLVEGITALNHSFSFLRRCEIIQCHRLEDVTGLQGVPEVLIANCSLITRIKGLRNHSLLEIRDCAKLATLPPLGTTKTVKISHCYELKDVSILYGIEEVYLTFLSKLIDLSGLGHHRFFYLYYCSNLEDVTILSSCNTVIITRCRKIKSFECLANVPHLEIDDCSKDTTLPSTFRNEKLILNLPYREKGRIEKEAIRPVLKPGVLQVLRLSRWEIADVADFQFLHSLTLSHCEDLENIDILAKTEENKLTHHLEYLVLDNCPKLKNVKGFHSMKRIRINWCGIITMIGFHNIETVELSWTDELIKLTDFKDIGLFVVRGCSYKNKNNAKPIFDFENIRCLIMEDFQGIYEITGKGDMQRLVVSSRTLVDLVVEGSIDLLEAEKCFLLSSINKVHAIRKISLVQCQQLVLPSFPWSTAREVKIENCKCLYDINFEEEFKDVPRATVTRLMMKLYSKGVIQY